MCIPTIVRKISLGKNSDGGILIDDTAGWEDIIGDISPDTTGAGSATLATFRGANTRAWFYTTNDRCDMLFHIPHNYKKGTDLYLHLHWVHQGTSISGELVVTYGVTYAKGHNQVSDGNFITEVAPVLT